jgi:hypothetical protein
VLCDVAREAGDELIGDLRTLGIDESGSIAVENIDLSLSKLADKAEEEAPGEAADAVLWEQLTDATHEESDWFSFVVAVLAGAAGMLSLTSAKSGALVGVAISVTTVPAAANAAVAFSYQQYKQAWGSTEQLLLNLLGIVLAGTLTLLAQKYLWAKQQERVASKSRP